VEPQEYESIYRLEETHWWYRGMRDMAMGLLDRYLLQRTGLTVLDAGCGTGGMMGALARYGRVYGVDFSSHALRFCRKRKLSTTVRASVTHIPYLDKRFDLATSFEVLYHAGVSDDVLALQEIFRVLRPGGLFLLRLPAFEWLRGAHDRTVHTRHRYTVREVREKLLVAGFELVRLSYANSLLFPVAAGSRLAERLTGREGQSGSDVQETAGWLNRLLLAPLQVEGAVLRYVNLPVGLSVLALARRPADVPTGPVLLP